MRDIHLDEGFMRDFNAASKNWSWATWHQVAEERDAVARRLLDQVFGQASTDNGGAAGGESGGDAAE